MSEARRLGDGMSSVRPLPQPPAHNLQAPHLYDVFGDRTVKTPNSDATLLPAPPRPNLPPTMHSSPPTEGLPDRIAGQTAAEPEPGQGKESISDMAALYSEYMEEASREDKQLEGRWTETLNILLIFGGLLAATITAFLIAVQPDLKPEPSDATNKILLQILQRLDNTTVIPIESDNKSSSGNTTRVLAWWYSSLACCLTATFGALLSKQWVLHYESRPSFASTLEKQCQLREVRHQGLAKWHFSGIIEILPILLQVSVFLFAIGLAEYLKPMPTLFVIALVFISFLASFYIGTLLVGMIFPSCPFKTPTTLLMFRALGVIAAWCAAVYLLLVTLFTCLPGAGRKPANKVFKLAQDTLEFFTNGLMRARWEIEFGEQSLLGKDSPGLSGVLGAQIQRHIGEDSPKVKGLEAAAEAIMRMPINIGASPFRQRPNFDLWSSEVIWRLGHTTPLPSSCLMEADLLFHIVYHLPDTAGAAKAGILHDRDLNIFTEKDSAGQLATLIRQSWGVDQDPGIPRLPITTMSPTTIATYLKFQLSHWCLQTPQERRHHEVIITELPVLLTYEKLHHPSYMHIATIDAISLAAIVLVRDDRLGNLQWEDFLKFDPLERLFQALHRMTYYPANGPPSTLFSLVMGATWTILSEDALRRKCSAYPSWQNRVFAQTLMRLLRLGRSWWQAEPMAWSESAPGANLVHQVRKVLALFAQDCTGLKDPSPPGISESGLGDLEEIFTLFAHPSAPAAAPPQVSLSALQLLDYALGIPRVPEIRSHRQPLDDFPLDPSSGFSDHPLDDFPLDPSSGSSDHPLARFPEVINQLIFTIQSIPTGATSQRKKFVLSVVIKGRYIFFPWDHGGVQAQLPPLLSQDLDALAGNMRHSRGPSGRVLGPLGGAAGSLTAARAWSALEPALALVLSSFSQPSQGGGYADLSDPAYQTQVSYNTPDNLVMAVVLPLLTTLRFGIREGLRHIRTDSEPDAVP